MGLPRTARSAAMMTGPLLLLLLGGWGISQVLSPAASAQSKLPMKQAFPRAEACKGCHERVYEEWEASPYARSIHSPAFRVLLEEYLAFSAGKDQGFCFQCHAPHNQEYKDLTPRFVGEVQSGDPTLDGVGCTQCHLIKEVGLSAHRAILRFQPGRTMFGPYADPVRNLAHKSVKMNLYQQSTFCLTCHKPPATVARLRKDQGLIGDWQTSKAAQSGKTCQSCHMPEKFGESSNGQRKREVFDHTFTGRDGKVRQTAAVLGITPMVEGDQTTLKVSVKNLAPHNLPMAHPGWAQLTLDLTIKGKNLKKVYGEQRHYGRRYANAEGEETVFDFTAMNVLADTTLKHDETRVEIFSFPTPRDTRSFDAEVGLMYAPISGPADFLKKVEAIAPQGEGDPAFQPIPLTRKVLNVPLR